ncbi:AIR synthase family protein [Halodesulfurarchaeum sp. HSR-GB]|uniref:AIR synthase family protein n=1 Tax=Halodesulfurarchaeum sp. HSR-GB TaxID=3074077 RepID=UPI00285C4F24|nr:AIR synthase family protein [Halodesulfurarchaeum sp. HSR-GB]MDR5655911.1 AIR synthase family protein [Halodesulfurarchaeum sp. HSR-GB]
MQPGKVDRDFFSEYIAGRLGADRPDVELGPTFGADFGLLSIGDRALALATDPVFVLRDLGLERAAWFAVHVLLSDVALSGLEPSHLAVDLSLPPGTDPETFETIWTVFDAEARELGVSIVTGHTGAYAGAAFPTIGAGTALAVGDPGSVVRPTGAKPGDRLLVTKGPAIETTGILGTVFGEPAGLDGEAVAAARDRFFEASPVEDAAIAARAGSVTAMHDATEGGLANALHELAHASGVGLRVESGQVPLGSGVAAVCSAFDIDPWVASSSGTVLLTVDPGSVESVRSALEEAGIRAGEIGTVESGGGVRVDGDPIPEPETDPFWPAYERARERYGPPEQRD